MTGPWSWDLNFGILPSRRVPPTRRRTGGPRMTRTLIPAALALLISCTGDQVVVREVEAKCGNGAVEAGEICDDGNSASGDVESAGAKSARQSRTCWWSRRTILALSCECQSLNLPCMHVFSNCSLSKISASLTTTIEHILRGHARTRTGPRMQTCRPHTDA